MPKRLFALVCALVIGLSVAAPASAKDHPSDALDMYSAVVDAGTAADLAKQGYDIAQTKVEADGRVRVTLVLSPKERAQLRKAGVQTDAVRDAKGRTSRQRALAQAASGFNVWRSYDEPGGIRDELYAIAKKNARLRQARGHRPHHPGARDHRAQGHPGRQGQKDGARPSVLYMSNQHAREWISVEVNRRLLNWYIDQRKLENPQIVELLKTTELWFILSANPDGYQYTFDHERLWRRNLRENNGDGQTTSADGVDPNRNYDAHWNFDGEGSSGQISSDTYRGTAPESEPETQAAAGLIDRIKPKLLVNYHSFGPLILYPQGWQTGTPDGDNPIYAALAGTDANPAIPGFDPGISADELYVTNGETTDYADTTAGTLAFTPELEQGCAGCGFVFPDDEALVQAQFEKTLPFDLDVALSAAHPGTPSSHLGNTVKPFYLSQTEVDPENGTLAMFDFRFDKSFGDPQEVRVLAKRSLGAVTLKYQVNGGAVQSVATTEWDHGERYGVGRRHLLPRHASHDQRNEPHQHGEGLVRRRRAVERLLHLHRRLRDRQPGPGHGGRGLHRRVAGPDRARITSATYQAALTANGIASDVYDVDANGRKAPDALGVLSHYDAVVWYTGNDIVTREPGGPAGTRRAWACRSCSRSATTSTRAASCCTPASTPGTSTPRSRHAELRPVREPAVLVVAGDRRALPHDAGLRRWRQRRPRVLVRGRL